MKKHFFLFAICFFILAIIFVSCSEHSDVVIVNSLFDLKDKKIACVEESLAEQFINDNIPRAKIVSFDETEVMLEKLKNAEVAVAIVDKNFAVSLVEMNEDFAISDCKLSDERLVILSRAFDMYITNFWRLHDEVGADF